MSSFLNFLLFMCFPYKAFIIYHHGSTASFLIVLISKRKESLQTVCRPHTLLITITHITLFQFADFFTHDKVIMSCSEQTFLP